MQKVKSRLHLAKRPSDFVKVAEYHEADVSNGAGSRKVVRYRGKTIGFSDHGNQEYSRSYRLLLIKAFIAAGLAAMVLMWIPGVF